MSTIVNFMFDRKSNGRGQGWQNSKYRLEPYVKYLENLGVDAEIFERAPSLRIKHVGNGQDSGAYYDSYLNLLNVRFNPKSEGDRHETMISGLSRYASAFYKKFLGFEVDDLPDRYVEDVLANLGMLSYGKPRKGLGNLEHPEKIAEWVREELQDETPWNRERYIYNFEKLFNERVGEIAAERIIERGLDEFIDLVESRTGKRNLYQVYYGPLSGAIQDYVGLKIISLDIKVNDSNGAQNYALPYIEKTNGIQKHKEYSLNPAREGASL